MDATSTSQKLYQLARLQRRFRVQTLRARHYGKPTITQSPGYSPAAREEPEAAQVALSTAQGADRAIRTLESSAGQGDQLAFIHV